MRAVGLSLQLLRSGETLFKDHNTNPLIVMTNNDRQSPKSFIAKIKSTLFGQNKVPYK